MSDSDTVKKVAAFVAGVGVGAVAGVTTLRAIGRDRRTVIHVEPFPESWRLRLNRERQPRRVFETKKEAVSAGRDLAHELAPSELVIHRSDGSVQIRHAYEE